MLDRLLPAAARAKLRALAARRAPGPTVLPGLDPRPGPMPPVRPGAATNDNPLHEVHDAVELELRARGLLR
ncbi:hypothetical protein Q8W71_12110 [Methylobacterium sp. NEAU 140]|uniref:hypothetical protein n=1 Tax=Methylobacterium sp. NEAU 140 TaxID=3064945 RepID=UPI0027342139|nr:hypothetical protein [Methylobacterium sp. NEAU 140]MDP4023373.1 hypothetical protein [Methylobacterium sp. NEAU 140]